MELKSRIIIMELVLFVLYLPMCLARFQSTDSGSALAFLDSISAITPENCEGGTYNAIDLGPNYSMWYESTRTARLTSNLMTSIILRHHGSVDSLTDELYYDVIKNNVAGQSKIFASSIILIPWFHPEFELFAPYAFVRDGIIHASDLFVAYDYRDPSTEWWQIPSNKNYGNVAGVTTMTEMQGRKYRKRTYFGDCWVHPSEKYIGYKPRIVFVSTPHMIFLLDTSGEYYAEPRWNYKEVWSGSCAGGIKYTHYPKDGKGVASIDIDLSSLDINQCDTIQPSDAFFNVFRGTHKCPENSECKFKPGTGQRRGGYQCVCKGHGAHTYSKRVFDGADLEKESASGHYVIKSTC